MDIPKNARGYLNTGDKLVDITLFNPSFANASGEMISTGEDMTTFFRALLGGKLLTPEMQKEMVTHTVIPIRKVWAWYSRNKITRWY